MLSAVAEKTNFSSKSVINIVDIIDNNIAIGEITNIIKDRIVLNNFLFKKSNFVPAYNKFNPSFKPNKNRPKKEL